MTATDVNDFLLGTDQLVRNGRYHLQGERFTRVTNFIKTVQDTYNLERYGKRVVAIGLAKRPDLIKAIRELDTETDKNKINDICDEAKEAANASAKADLGTAVHTLAEISDRGETLDFGRVFVGKYAKAAEHLGYTSERAADDIAAYRQALSDNKIKTVPSMMERVIVHRGYGVAGRFDRVVYVEGHEKPYIADIKTGTLDFGLPEIAAQLWVYATADHIFDEDNKAFIPMIDVDRERAIVLHLPAGSGKCEPLFIDLAVGKKVADMCGAVRELRREKVKPVPVASAPVIPPNDRARWLADRAATLRSTYPEAFAELAAQWPADVPTFKKGGHTPDQINSIALLLSTVEAKHGVMFGETDPNNRRPDTQDVNRLVARLNALPPEMLAVVEKTAKDAGIPNLKTRKATVAHLLFVEQLVGDAEQAAHESTTEAAAR